MKKMNLLVCAVIAVLASGSVATEVQAAEGWKRYENDSNWYYLDGNDNKVTNTWKKGADGLWRYLNSSGQMAVSTWVDNTYYMDSNGILVTDKWLKIQDSGSLSARWYYFGSSGKVLTDTWSKIDNKWYHFDDSGIMETGWIQDDSYYCGSDGVMRTGWQKLYPSDEDNSSNKITPSSDSDDGKFWYYFASNGKKYTPKSGNEYSTYKVDGITYCFDINGAMQTGWRQVSGSGKTIESYKYFDAGGRIKTGWLSVEPPEDLDIYDSSVEWFYFSSAGVPKSGPKSGKASTSDLVKINGNTYLFNEKGNPVYGLQKLRIGNSDSTYTAYYFGNKKTSSMQKGKIKIQEGDGSETSFYFSESGRGYTGVKDGYLYYMGKLQKAEDGTKYEVISLPAGSGYTSYVVNISGKVAKSTTVKNSEGVKYKTNGSGILTHINGEAASAASYTEPREPIWN